MHTAPSADIRLNRLRWHCRRGMLELDVVLADFAARALPGLDADGLADFEAMLALEDADLWDLILGKAESDNTGWQAILARLRQPLEDTP